MPTMFCARPPYKVRHQNKTRFQDGLLVMLLALLPLFLPQQASAKMHNGKGKMTVGAWQISCGRPPGSKFDKCAASQSVAAADLANTGLLVVIQKPGRGEKLIMTIVAPMGIYLPKGLGLQIDGLKFGEVPFIRCGSRNNSANRRGGIGCFAQAIINKKIMTKMSKGKYAYFTFFLSPQENGIAIPLQLKGFAKAIQKVK